MASSSAFTPNEMALNDNVCKLFSMNFPKFRRLLLLNASRTRANWTDESENSDVCSRLCINPSFRGQRLNRRDPVPPGRPRLSRSCDTIGGGVGRDRNGVAQGERIGSPPATNVPPICASHGRHVPHSAHPSSAKVQKHLSTFPTLCPARLTPLHPSACLRSDEPIDAEAEAEAEAVDAVPALEQSHLISVFLG
ncbi:unnamed protein product [Protopolystoma xenopodis]|uniref:Uncharacterized protein n=1 Tax=Protopolystoma xenopodis TaxID=117903 RepID=A0A3S5APS3_9PLAT|nr:unnamed protein product [Protopolystoma xenopodis]